MTPIQLGRSAHADRRASRLGVLGASLGIAAGAVEVTVGSHIGPWIGGKADPTRLGIVTLALGTVALAAALVVGRTEPVPPPRRAAAGVMLTVTGLTGMTTTGRLWVVPGALLLIAAAALAWGMRGDARLVAQTLERRGPTLLTGVVAVLYVLLGFTALGLAGWAGIVAGCTVLTLVAMRPAWVVPVRAPLLCTLVLPFALATWWSVVSPLAATLIVGLGSVALSHPRLEPPVAPSLDLPSIALRRPRRPVRRIVAHDGRTVDGWTTTGTSSRSR